MDRHLLTTTLLALSLACLASPVVDAATSWSDVEGRIQYGYYTEDLRTLKAVADTIEAGDPAEAMRGYYQGLARYRMLLVASGRNKDVAKDAAEACVDDLGASLKAQADSPESLALQAACMGILSGLKPWKAPVLGSRSTSQLERAVKLAPRNPRVLLLDALADYERPGFVGGDKERAFGKLQKAVAAFESERQGETPLPGWGAAEAYAYLARSYLDRGDALAARSALERALLLAPEYAYAKKLMTRIAAS